MHRSTAVLLLLLLASAASAQPAATALEVCDTGTARADLVGRGVRVPLYTTGSLFGRFDVRAEPSEVPRGSERSPLDVASLWLGGESDGETRFAGATYGNWGGWEFWPGPLDADAQPQAELCAAFDRIWTVTSAAVAAYAASGTTTPDLAGWPVGAGAPFFVDADGDGVQGATELTVALRPGDADYDPARVIDLEGGERPVVFGGQTAWWVLNDRGGNHAWSGAAPLGVEVRVTAWTLSERSWPPLEHSTFVRFDVLNRSAETLDRYIGGVYVGGGLGYFNDDYLHSDPDREMFVLYNGDELDEGPWGYGVPPALGVDILSGGAGTRFFTGSGTATGDVSDAAGALLALRGFWNDGTPVTIGGYHRDGGGEPTRWVYPADPLRGLYWSEENTDGAGHRNTPAARRGVIATPEAPLAPGASRTIDVAVLFAQGTDRLDSVRWLRAVSDLAQQRYASGALFAREGVGAVARAAPAAAALGLDVRPNPAAALTTVTYRLAAAGPVRLAVVDVLGRTIAVLAAGDRVAGEHRAPLDPSALAPGVYLLVLRSGERQAVRTITIAR